MDIALVHVSRSVVLGPPETRARAAGHRVITMDLPISDPAIGAADYAQKIEAALEPGVEPMLVGHAMAGGERP